MSCFRLPPARQESTGHVQMLAGIAQLLAVAMLVGSAVLLSVSSAAAQPTASATESGPASLEQASDESSASTDVEAPAASEGDGESGGLSRTIWIGAAAALFLLIAGAVGANDKHKRKHQH